MMYFDKQIFYFNKIILLNIFYFQSNNFFPFWGNTFCVLCPSDSMHLKVWGGGWSSSRRTTGLVIAHCHFLLRQTQNSLNHMCHTCWALVLLWGTLHVVADVLVGIYSAWVPAGACLLRTTPGQMGGGVAVALVRDPGTLATADWTGTDPYQAELIRLSLLGIWICPEGC